MIHDPPTKNKTDKITVIRLRKFLNIGIFALMIVGLGLHFMLTRPDILEANRMSLVVMRSVQQEPGALAQVKPGLANLAQKDCRSNWMLGIVLKQMGDQTGKKAAWQRLLDCPGADLGFLIAAGRQDEDLAKQIVVHDPENPAALLSLAYITYSYDPSGAIAWFEKGLTYDPTNGAAWCYLGALYSSAKQPEKALEAYANCCYNGDPYGGCYRAGLMMEKMGDPQKAIQYYRLSIQEKDLERADELEKELQP
jgi:tetratricopeptide (TPR) repeat protein